MASEHQKYLVYVPAGGDALVKSGRSTIYFTPEDRFFAAVDTYLVKATWVALMSWDNDTNAPQSYVQSCTTQLKITQGSEVTNSVNVGAAYEGLSLSMGTSEKTFSSTETTTSATLTKNVTIPAQSRVTFYQRVYEFRTTMFFINYGWHEEWNAGSPGGYNITRKECTVQIMSEEYFTESQELSSGVGLMTVATVPRADNEDARLTRKRENLTKKAKDALSRMGV